jgi:hypothetical protein
VVMAAGVGSRFGGTKQLAEVGPAGEALLDYTIVDARRAGFDRVVLIVRQEIRDAVAAHLAEIHPDADRFTLVCQDYYGREAFVTLAGELSAGGGEELHLVAYELAQTLSPRGSVSRGVCQVASDGTLADITEHLTIAREGDGTIRAGAGGPDLAPDTPVSMNLWGLQPFVFDHLAAGFARFVEEHRGDERAEFLLPEVIDGLVSSGVTRVRVHRTAASWLGVTYPGDLDDARARIAELVDAGVYSSPLGSSPLGSSPLGSSPLGSPPLGSPPLGPS